VTLLVLWYVCAFVIGLTVGSFLNVCVARLPFEKSLIWPGSCCPACYQPIRWYDNIPVLSYLWLRGRCRSCGIGIPLRYPAVELLTGVAFVALFHVEMVANWLDLGVLRRNWGLAPGLLPPEALWLFFHHALLLSFLLVASLCDLQDMEVPLSVTGTGTLVGLILATLFPWPFPEPAPQQAGSLPPYSGIYAWPVWYPLPAWLPAGSWQLGLATGLAGALVGTLLVRLVRSLFEFGRGIEGMGIGDADLMMMAGAFLGWQPVVLGFFAAAPVGLVFGLAQLLFTGRQALPFVPALSVGLLLVLFNWPALGRHFAPGFFDPILMAALTVFLVLGLPALAFLLRLIR